MEDGAVVVRGETELPPAPHVSRGDVVEPDRGMLLSHMLPRMPLDGMVPSLPTVPPVSGGDGAVTVVWLWAS